MMSVMPSDTMTMVIGDVPRRWNGAYTPEFSSTDPAEHAATATTRPSHTDVPAWLTAYAMKAPAIMMAPYARLSTSVTPNCRVKPTDAIASTAAVTRPNPMDARKTVTGGPLGVAGDRPAQGKSSGQGPQLVCRQVADDVDGAGRAVGVDLEDAGRVVEAVEARRAARPLVPDGLARLERGRALGERVHHRGAGHAVPDLDHVRRVHARAGAVRHDHGQGGQVDPVVQVHSAGRAQVRGEVAGGAGDLALLGQERGRESLVGGPAGLRHQVVGAELGRERRRAHRRGRGLEERRRDRGRRGHDRDHLAAVELLDLREQGRVRVAKRLRHDRVGMRLDDRLGLRAEGRSLQVQRLVGGQGDPGLLQRADRGLDEGLRPDVVAERQRDPLVVQFLRDRDHRVGLLQVGRHQPVEVREHDMVELRLPGHAEHGHLLAVDDRHDRGGLVRRAADHQREAGGGREQLADRGDRVGRVAPGVHGLAGQLVPEHAARAVDRRGRAVAGGQVRRPEGRVRAGERGDVGDREGGAGRAGRFAGAGAGAAAAAAARRHAGGERGGGQHRSEGPELHRLSVLRWWTDQKPLFSGWPGRHRQSLGAPSSATTRLRMVPTSSTVTSMTSPGYIQTGGFRAKPTPPGVPVAMTSPGARRVNEEKNSTALGTSTSICEVRADCMTWPLSVELMARSLTSTSSVVTTSGPIGMLPSKFLPAVHWVAARCQSRADASLTTTKPAIASRALSAVMYRPPAPMTMPSSPS